MKKIVSILLFGLATIFLISCSKQKSLDGDYYWISDNRNEKIMTIDDDSGTVESNGDLLSL